MAKEFVIKHGALVHGAITPIENRVYWLGADDKRWQIVFCETLDSAGIHEKNLQNAQDVTPIGEYETGTVLVWRDGKNLPCTIEGDYMRMGIAVNGQNSPLVQGAEPVLCTGEVKEGDYLITSNKIGHAKAITRNVVRQQMLWDCVIGRALEDGDGESHLVKTWVKI